MTKHGNKVIHRLLLLASTVFVALAYLLVLVQVIRKFPLLSAPLFWGISAGVYFFIFGALFLLYHFSDAVFPEFPALLERWTEKRGLRAIDRWGLFMAIAAFVMCLIRAPHLLALPAIGVLGLLASAAIPAKGIEAEEARSLYRPPEVPEKQVEPPLSFDAPRPEQVPEGVEIREYEWEIKWGEGESTKQWMWIPFLSKRVEEFKAKNPYRKEPRPSVIDPYEFVNNGITSEVLHAANHFMQETKRRKWTLFQEVCNVLAFVQSIPYKSDEESVGFPDYFRYPIETLYDKEGDCEDTSILAASILKALGHEVILLFIEPEHEGEPAHMAIGVSFPGMEGFPPGIRLFRYGGKVFFYCETTAEGWHVGEVPAEYIGREIKVYPA